MGVLNIYIYNQVDLPYYTFNQLLLRLPMDRRLKVTKFHFYQDKCSCLLGYILAIYGIKKTFGVDLSNQSFAFNRYGKPYFQLYPDIHFNISHCRSKVVCAVSDAPVGIDVQDVMKVEETCYKTVLSPQELLYINKCNNPESEFIRFWTLKEAYTKYLGIGLNQEFNQLDMLSNDMKCIYFRNTYIHVTMQEECFVAVCSQQNLTVGAGEELTYYDFL